MSTSETSAAVHGRPSGSFWFLAVGVTLALLGALAFGATTILEVTSLLMLGPLLLANSLCQLMLTFIAESPRRRAFHISSALFSLVVGFLVMSHESEAGADIALLMAAFLLVAGLNRMVGSLEPDLPPRVWLVAAGALAVSLGICLSAQAPTRGLWLISLCIAIDFLCHGATWIWYWIIVRGKVDTQFPESEVALSGTPKAAQLQH
jgi:uncharacterized membrane protein HdeD (DUF308 family)